MAVWTCTVGSARGREVCSAIRDTGHRAHTKPRSFEDTTHVDRALDVSHSGRGNEYSHRSDMERAFFAFAVAGAQAAGSAGDPFRGPAEDRPRAHQPHALRSPRPQYDIET